MSSLDRHVMHYFAEEMEKQALLGSALAGFGKIVSSAGKAAGKGALQYSKGMQRVSAMGKPITAKHVIGGGLLAAGSIYAAKKGLDAARKEYATLKPLKPRHNTGIQNLGGM